MQQCPHCGISKNNYTNATSFYRHVRDCNVSYQCNVCNKTLKGKTKLNEHVKTHTNPIICDQCFIPLGSARALKLHKLTHEEIICDECNKKCNGRTINTHQCASKRGPKTVTDKLPTESIDNIKTILSQRHPSQGNPTIPEVHRLLQQESADNNIPIFRPSHCVRESETNYRSTKSFCIANNIVTRSNNDPMYIPDLPWTELQILHRCKTDEEVE
eukprot:191748_1